MLQTKKHKIEKREYLNHGKLGTDSEWISLSSGLVNVLLNVQWSNH